MQKILTWLDGKKSSILAILSLIIVYLIQDSTISQNLGLLLQGILSILAGGAVVMTKDMQGSNKLGIRK